MKLFVRLALVVSFAVAAIGAERLDALGRSGPLLTLEPTDLSVAPGEHRLVYVRVNSIPSDGLAAFQVELQYDPQTIAIVDPNAGYGVSAFAPLWGSPLCATIRRTLECADPEWMLTSTGRQAIGTATLDAAAGRLTIAYGTRGAVAPVAGSGVLAVIEVVGLSGARARLEIDSAILADAADPPGRYTAALSRPTRATPRRKLDR